MKGIFGLFILTTIMLSCTFRSPQNKEIRSLSDNWEFSRVGDKVWYPAVVPGTVHTDLMQNNLIPDPFIGFNEDSVQWIEDKDWEYKMSFVMSLKDLAYNNIELAFEGLDTYADVYLNDSLLLQADNMFIAWDKNCKKYLKEGKNDLRIYFRSPVKTGMDKLRKLDYNLIATNEQAPADKKTNVFTRKAPFHYGWDWGPRLVTSGIWRPVNLRSWNDVIIRDVHLIQQNFSPDECSYQAGLEIQSSEGGQYEVSILADGTEMASTPVDLKKGMNSVDLELNFEHPELWWSNGLGKAKLYDVEARIVKSGTTLDAKSVELGIRKIELVQEVDSVGRSFFFRLNGIPVFMKGSNYIPGDIFIPSVTPEKYERVVREAADANMNMLRVWGGAIYENDIFYDLCDRYGILVWQDFMFACALQPGDSAHLENIRKEAVYNVKRLRNHPCMALWCGNNENLIAWHNWGWQDKYTSEQRDFLWKTYTEIFYSILPEAVKDYDPALSYWASSPQSFGDTLPDGKSGDEHDWSVWFASSDFKDYGNHSTRFVSEYGLQSFPQMSTLEYFAKPEDMTMFSKVLDHRQRCRMDWMEPGFNGNDLQLRYIKRYLPEPGNFEDFVYLSQISHQLAMKEAIEAHRRMMPVCMGSLYWQINDCWPTISWASVDYFGNWKAPHYQARRSFERIILAPELKENKIELYVVSDDTANIDAILQLQWLSTEGTIVGKTDSHNIRIQANTSTLLATVGIPEKECNRPSDATYLIARIVRENNVITEKLIPFCKPKEEKLRHADIRSTVTKTETGYKIVLGTTIPARFVRLELPGMQGSFSDNYFNLLPGSDKTIDFTSSTSNVEGSSQLRITCLNNL